MTEADAGWGMDICNEIIGLGRLRLWQDMEIRDTMFTYRYYTGLATEFP